MFGIPAVVASVMAEILTIETGIPLTVQCRQDRLGRPMKPGGPAPCLSMGHA
jgi:hypothetical protein